MARETEPIPFRACGGIGRHAGFRFQWFTPYGFESRQAHSLYSKQTNSVPIMHTCFFFWCAA